MYQISDAEHYDYGQASRACVVNPSISSRMQFTEPSALSPADADVDVDKSVADAAKAEPCRKLIELYVSK